MFILSLNRKTQTMILFTKAPPANALYRSIHKPELHVDNCNLDGTCIHCVHG